jgi:hypothetical protein
VAAFGALLSVGLVASAQFLTTVTCVGSCPALAPPAAGK